MKMSDEFFIGWQGRAPEQTGRFVRRRAWVLLIVSLALALAALQETIGNAFFEFGKLREFTGTLIKDPVPILVADDPDDASGTSIYYLVNPFKYGFEPEVAAKHHLRRVKLKGALIYREGGEAMIEVAEGSLEAAAGAHGGGNPLAPMEALGAMTLRGEIVDSKCFLGVMNPGNLKAHRACAVRCIAGGIPPVLLVRNESGDAQCFLLVDEDGGAVHRAVVDYVALPVEITGHVEAAGNLLVLKARPDQYRLLRGGERP